MKELNRQFISILCFFDIYHIVRLQGVIVISYCIECMLCLYLFGLNIQGIITLYELVNQKPTRVSEASLPVAGRFWEGSSLQYRYCVVTGTVGIITYADGSRHNVGLIGIIVQDVETAQQSYGMSTEAVRPCLNNVL